jgi:hypothetical protein
MKNFLAILFLLTSIIAAVFGFDHFLNDQKIRQMVLPAKEPMVVIKLTNFPEILKEAEDLIPANMAGFIPILEGMISKNITIAVIQQKEGKLQKIRVIAKLDGEITPSLEVQMGMFPSFTKKNHTYFGLYHTDLDTVKKLYSKIPKLKKEPGIYMKINTENINGLIAMGLAMLPQKANPSQKILIDTFTKEVEAIEHFEMQITCKDKTLQLDQITKVDPTTPLGKMLCLPKGKNIKNVAKFLPMLDQNFVVSIDPTPIQKYLGYIKNKVSNPEISPFFDGAAIFLNSWSGNMAVIQSLKNIDTPEGTMVLESSMTKEILKLGLETIPGIQTSTSNLGSLEIISIKADIDEPMTRFPDMQKQQEVHIGIAPPLIFISNNKHQLTAIIRDLRKSAESPYNLFQMLELTGNQISRNHTKLTIPEFGIKFLIDTQTTTLPEKGVIQSATQIKLQN